jgi:WD40-like Beta Propeller Repeat
VVFELSPDGRRIAFVSRADNGPRRIYVRSLDRWDAVAIPGTEGAHNPIFSPDGQWIAFQQARQIRKVPFAGGTPVVLVERLNNAGPDWGPPGMTWGRNGAIVFSHGLGVALSMVREAGGEPEEITTLDAAANESSHRLPHFLPDGSAVLFTVLRYTNVSPDWTRAQVWVKSLKTGERKLLIENALDAQYAGNGILVFARQTKLFAVRFDPATLSVSGTPVQVLDGVTHALYGSAGITWTGAAQFSIANGTLLYAPGSSVRFKIAGAEFVPEKPVMLFRQPLLVGGTSVRPTYDVAPDGRFLFNLPIPETGDERNRRIFPSTLRLVQNWTEDIQRLFKSQ